MPSWPLHVCVAKGHQPHSSKVVFTILVADDDRVLGPKTKTKGVVECRFTDDKRRLSLILMRCRSFRSKRNAVNRCQLFCCYYFSYFWPVDNWIRHAYYMQHTIQTTMRTPILPIRLKFNIYKAVHKASSDDNSKYSVGLQIRTRHFKKNINKKSVMKSNTDWKHSTHKKHTFYLTGKRRFAIINQIWHSANTGPLIPAPMFLKTSQLESYQSSATWTQ